MSSTLPVTSENTTVTKHQLLPRINKLVHTYGKRFHKSRHHKAHQYLTEAKNTKKMCDGLKRKWTGG